MNEKLTKRKKTAGYSHAKADARKNKRRAAAEARQAVYSATPVEERLAGLDRRDLEARRERAKLYPLAHCVAIVPNKTKTKTVTI